MLSVVIAVFTLVRPYLIQITVDKAIGRNVPISPLLKFFLFKTDFSSRSHRIPSAWFQSCSLKVSEASFKREARAVMLPDG